VLLQRFIVPSMFAALALGACAKPPTSHPSVAAASPVHAFQATDSTVTGQIQTVGMPLTDMSQPIPRRVFSTGSLPGRTLTVGSAADIALEPREVILTFDDGPRPGKTDRILETLEDFNVRATFLMLGMAAQTHPELAQRVALAGHTVGSHTYEHIDLTTLTQQEAMDEIARGERAVAAALGGAGQVPAPFFRFPYLAQSGFLRTNLIQGNVVVLDVDIDSKDYYHETPQAVIERTLARLDAQGSGIILFHDIHQRTVDLLPSFLAALESRGYSVVRLAPRDPGVFGRDIVTAQVPH
jgi:peptidoglycan/xylan/chitin deacetylase (PgdA/CDA1 family)